MATQPIRLTACSMLLMLLGISPGSGQTPTVPDGEQFLVNSYTTSLQLAPSVAMSSDGTFVVAWADSTYDNGDTSSRSVQARRFASSGEPLGEQFLVNTYTTNLQTTPSVAVDEEGDFVISWVSFGTDSADTGIAIQGQRFASNGDPLGSEIPVNTYTSGAQFFPSIAIDAHGDFVVVWESDGSDNGDDSELSVQGQLFASNGDPVGSQFLVNTYTSQRQESPSAAMNADGDFIAVWESDGSDNGDTSATSVQGQRYFSNGNPSGSQFLVNTYTTDDQINPTVAIAEDGSFVVVWVSDSSDNGDDSGASVQGQRFLSNGDRAGGQFLINTYTPENQFEPSVAMDGARDFVVVWRSIVADNGDTSDSSIQAQRYASNGDAIGGQFLVNTYTTNLQYKPSVAAKADGDFTVTWVSLGADNGDISARSVQGQHFRVNADVGDLVFLDADFDGIRDPSEAGIPGIQVHLFEADGDLVASTETDGDGLFSFETKVGVPNIVDGLYLEYEAPARYSFTLADAGDDDTIDSDADPVTGQTEIFQVLSAGVAYSDMDAGLANGIGDRVWEDQDGNGLQDGGEPGVAGVTVELFDGLDVSRGMTTTSADGRYSFPDLDPGTYYLAFTAPGGFVFTARDQGADDAVDSDVNPATGTTPAFVFTNGDQLLGWDAGLAVDLPPTARVGNQAWLDTNQNGVRNGGESGVAGVTVNLYREPDPPTRKAMLVGTEITNSDGFYSFTVAPGTYYLEFVCDSGTFAPPDQGSDDALDSDVEPSTGTTSPFDLVEGADDTTRDAGLIDPDGDGAVCPDNCPGDRNPDQADSDGDGVGDVCDLCTGNDASGDADQDGLCANIDCDDNDPANGCHVFGDGFESGDLTSWGS